MSTRYFIKCLECGNEISIADRSFHGVALTPDTKGNLARFAIDHCGHNIEIFSEYDVAQHIYYCPECGTELEIDNEVSIQELPLECWVLRCSECNEVYNGEEV